MNYNDYKNLIKCMKENNCILKRTDTMIKYTSLNKDEQLGVKLYYVINNIERYHNFVKDYESLEDNEDIVIKVSNKDMKWSCKIEKYTKVSNYKREGRYYDRENVNYIIFNKDRKGKLEDRYSIHKGKIDQYYRTIADQYRYYLKTINIEVGKYSKNGIKSLNNKYDKRLIDVYLTKQRRYMNLKGRVIKLSIHEFFRDNNINIRLLFNKKYKYLYDMYTLLKLSNAYCKDLVDIIFSYCDTKLEFNEHDIVDIIVTIPLINYYNEYSSSSNEEWNKRFK